MAPGVLVIGGGQAASHMACTLRQHGFQGAITIVGDEPHGPYQRPPLSKAYLSGTATASNLQLRAPKFYDDQRIDVVTSDPIIEIDVDDIAAGGSARGSSGRVYNFEHLAFATGAEAVELTVPGCMLPEVLTMRTLADADRLRVAFETAQDVVVVGGGFIGLEVAAAARARSLSVTVIEAGPRLAARALGPDMSRFLRAAHERRGVRVLTSSTVTAMVGDEAVAGVALSNGSVVPADLVVVGIGARPRTQLAERIGIECESGIVIDDFGRTSRLGVVAAGDCTVMPDPTGHGARVRLESVQNAIDQAETAARTVLGVPVPNRATPWFWSDQADIKLQVAGLVWGSDLSVVRGDVDSEKFSILHFRGTALAAIEAINSPKEFMHARRLITQGASIDPSAAIDTSRDLKDLQTASVLAP